MSLGRRKVRVQDHDSWVFNRMVDAYAARPPYPHALVDAVAETVRQRGQRVLDVGAGIGHLALPLCARGLAVTAVEPAIEMLERLRQMASASSAPLALVHAMAEMLPLPSRAFELVLVADAVHFLDPLRAAYELSRVLTSRGTLVVITCEFGDTRFMRAVTEVMRGAAPRRPRDTTASVAQLLAVVGGKRNPPRVFHDETLVEPDVLENILRSISFIGPAMNPARYAAFRERILAIDGPRRWARTFTLYSAER